MKRSAPQTGGKAEDVGITCVFGPLQDGRDLVAFLRFADAVASGCADPDGVQVGLHPAQKGRCRGGAVWDLEVDAVGLQEHNQLLLWRNIL